MGNVMKLPCTLTFSLAHTPAFTSAFSARPYPCPCSFPQAELEPHLSLNLSLHLSLARTLTLTTLVLIRTLTCTRILSLILALTLIQTTTNATIPQRTTHKPSLTNPQPTTQRFTPHSLRTRFTWHEQLACQCACCMVEHQQSPFNVSIPDVV